MFCLWRGPKFFLEWSKERGIFFKGLKGRSVFFLAEANRGTRLPCINEVKEGPDKIDNSQSLTDGPVRLKSVGEP